MIRKCYVLTVFNYFYLKIHLNKLLIFGVITTKHFIVLHQTVGAEFGNLSWVLVLILAGITFYSLASAVAGPWRLI